MREEKNLDNSYDLGTKLGSLPDFNNDVSLINKPNNLYKYADDPNVKRKFDLEQILFNLFIRKDNTKYNQQLSDFASYFAKKQ